MRNDLVRGFAIGKDEKFSDFKWSNDSKYLARLKKDILIVYEAPKMLMLPDAEGKRQPIKDGIKEYQWFPNKNIILTITEKRSGNKLSESILQFFEIPTRKTFPPSSISGFEISALEWHKNNNILAVTYKSTDKNPKWSVRIFEFDTNKYFYKMAHVNLTTDSSTTAPNYYTLQAKWFDSNLLVVPKFKEGLLDTMCIFPYKLDKNTLKIEPWANEKFLKNVKYSSFIPSSDGIHFIVANLDTNNSNSYGKVDLYAIFDNTLNFCRTFDFSNNLENVKWDKGGRLFVAEITRRQPEGIKFYDCQGNLLFDCRDTSIQNVLFCFNF